MIIVSADWGSKQSYEVCAEFCLHLQPSLKLTSTCLYAECGYTLFQTSDYRPLNSEIAGNTILFPQSNFLDDQNTPKTVFLDVCFRNSHI